MVSRSSTNSTSLLATKRSVMMWERRMDFSRVSRISGFSNFPFLWTSTQDQLSLTRELALHFLVHFLVLNTRPAHFIGMLGQDFAHFFVQAVFDADFLLHGDTHSLCKGGLRWRFNHFGREQALDYFAGHISDIIAREKHEFGPLKSSAKQFT